MLKTTVVLACGLLAAACGQSEAPRSPEPQTPPPKPANVVSKDLPSGRFQIPTKNTPVPDLWITLPEGFTIRSASESTSDEFYIFRMDDPNLASASAASAGFLRIYIGPYQDSALTEGQRVQHKKGLVGGIPVTWTYWSERLPDSGTAYKREMRSSDFFSGLSPELAKIRLYFQLYVEGSDSARVEALMTATQTLGTKP